MVVRKEIRINTIIGLVSMLRPSEESRLGEYVFASSDITTGISELAARDPSPEPAIFKIHTFNFIPATTGCRAGTSDCH